MPALLCGTSVQGVQPLAHGTRGSVEAVDRISRGANQAEPEGQQKGRLNMLLPKLLPQPLLLLMAHRKLGRLLLLTAQPHHLLLSCQAPRRLVHQLPTLPAAAMAAGGPAAAGDAHLHPASSAAVAVLAAWVAAAAMMAGGPAAAAGVAAAAEAEGTILLAGDPMVGVAVAMGTTVWARQHLAGVSAGDGAQQRHSSSWATTLSSSSRFRPVAGSQVRTCLVHAMVNITMACDRMVLVVLLRLRAALPLLPRLLVVVVAVAKAGAMLLVQLPLGLATGTGQQQAATAVAMLLLPVAVAPILAFSSRDVVVHHLTTAISRATPVIGSSNGAMLLSTAASSPCLLPLARQAAAVDSSSTLPPAAVQACQQQEAAAVTACRSTSSMAAVVPLGHLELLLGLATSLAATPLHPP